MSRSRRKTSIASISCSGFRRGEKKDKVHAHHALRRRVKEIMAKGDEDKMNIDKKETSQVYAFRKDGKKYFDPKKHPKMMRK